MGNWQYDNADLERLSTIMPLHDIGFTVEEVEAYMRLLLEGDHTQLSGSEYCWKNAAPHLRRSTPRNANFSGWITCAMRSERHKETKEIKQILLC